MGTIRNLTNRFKALNFAVIKHQALVETAPEIIPEMTEQQQRSGIRSDGEFIEPDLQNNIYAKRKIESGGMAPFGIPDLRNSGNFQRNLRTVITEVSLKTYSLDTKADELEKKYTPLIYGATKENLAIYAKENLLPVLMGKLKAATVG